MAKLKVDFKDYLEQLKRECTDLDMNQDPEVGHIKDPEKRKKEADEWLECRINQLNGLETQAKMDLGNVGRTGVVGMTDYFETLSECRKLYDGAREQARELYNQTVSEEVTV